MLLFSCFVLSAYSEQLPLKTYTVADGLASNLVFHIFQDRKGFIWFATGEGLSLFDGYGFKNYDESDGLPPAAVRFIAEDDHGKLWIGTFRGIARFDDSASFESNESQTKKKKFVTFKIADGDTLKDKVKNQISRILFDADGNLWCLTDYGLYKTAEPNAAELKFETVIERDTAFSGGAFRDPAGSLWFGLGDELFEIRGAEIVNRGSVGIPFPKNLITGITRDAKGRLLVSDVKDLFEFLPSSEPNQKGVFRKIFTVKEGASLRNVLAAADGKIWVGTDDELIQITGDKTSEFNNFGSSPVKNIWSLANDRDGNLWIGLFNSGVRVLESESIINYVPKRADSKAVGDLFENADGKIWAMLVNYFPAVIENGELIEKDFDYPLPASPSVWFGKNETGWNYAAQNQGLRIKSPKLRLKNGQILDAAKYIDSESDGNRFYEDERGILWIAKRDGKLYRGTPDGAGDYDFESFPTETPFSFFASRIISDGDGGVWLTHPLFTGRFRNGVYSPVELSEGLPEKDPRSVFRDSRGWLWIGLRNKGVSVTREPAAEKPFFTNYSKINSPLRSNAVRSITEDDAGRMYFATDNGVSRLDLTKNEWTHFSSQTGLAGDMVFGVYRDGKGFIWAATESGLSRIDLRLEKNRTNLPPIYLTSINIAGKNWNLPATGLVEIPKIELAPDENNLTISFTAPNFEDENLVYQYKLGEADWSDPGKERAVSFSNLPDGSYRFAVRAVNQNGLTSINPAVFEFRILPPVWQRWWFVAGMLALAAFMIYRIYRLRVARLLEIERTRTRIATDLHDDIGTNLSKISLLSEIVKMQLANENEERTRMLDVIGETSRESVGAMSDIVWAINPKKDSLADMTRRMIQHAEAVFLEKGVKVKFDTPEDDRNSKLSMEIRRELYLIFKEAVTNAAKHSDCRNVEIEFRARKNEIFLRVKDDGCGFDIEKDANGNGLKNLQIRAERIGAKMKIESKIGGGTCVSVSLKQ